MDLDVSLSRVARFRIFLTRLAAWLREPVYFSPRSRIRVAVMLVLLGVVSGYAGSAWYAAHSAPSSSTVGPTPTVSVAPGKADFDRLPPSAYERVPGVAGVYPPPSTEGGR
ncbi:Uncharacterised protein [Mycobacteroides abscessus subsp. bolletii]|nr:Uncharacterised protein [Mycobacteroides abscessus]SKF49488.1 Uncharacterised protein [Mycobacteroides abscessus subsp. bolletii]SKH11062.1 Uncharacterised protein [Mycobacteroides abscessus subsp. bolletii]